jgi:RecA/RadA recombinase
MAKSKKVVDQDAVRDEILQKLKKANKVLVPLQDDVTSFIPWTVPFNHIGLQKITGGLLGGKIMVIEGFSQTGKSWLLYELYANCIKMGGWVYHEDCEQAFEPAYGATCGIDYSTKRFMLSNETVVEEISINITNFITNVRSSLPDSSIPIVVGIDSLAATRCAEQYANDEKEKNTGYGNMKRANAVYEVLDKLLPILHENNASLVIINQLREDKSVGMFADPTKAMFPNLNYRATQVLRGKLSTVEKDVDNKEIKTAQHVRWETYKNRAVRPKQFIKLKYDFEKGMPIYSGVFDLLVRDKEIIADKQPHPDDSRKKVAGCYVVGDETKTFWPLTNAKEMFKKYPNLLEPRYVKIHEQTDNDDQLDVEEMPSMDGIE